MRDDQLGFNSDRPLIWVRAIAIHLTQRKLMGIGMLSFVAIASIIYESISKR
ncbi:MAG: hypothetical protein EBE86_034650 [Hormoscilla sp. GUM202]|nr:hypothetical protein [Hormoscilla sp. GUM202]